MPQSPAGALVSFTATMFEMLLPWCALKSAQRRCQPAPYWSSFKE